MALGGQMAGRITDLDTDTAAAQQLFASLDGMEGLPQAPVAPVKADRFPYEQALRRVYPGLIVAATIGIAATWLSTHYSAPVMLYALLLGMAFHFLHEDGACVAGIEFTSKAVLRVGVALLGARITAEQIMSLGAMPILLVVAGVITTILVGALLAKRLGLSQNFGVLSGGAVAICGASAALAIASVLPKTRDSERDTILTVVTVTALSTIAMIIYPLIARAVGFDNTHAGIFIGGTIHDVAQVVGAGYSISDETGNTATYVKLLRVAMLVPVVFAIALMVRRGTPAAGGSAPRLPTFLIGFVVLVIVNSLGLLPGPVVTAAGELSRWCLVTAIAALGMKTSFKALAAVGWKPVGLMVAETLWIGALVLLAVYYLV
ncbi:MAG: YeiH family protein [Polymorphobacter sp.]